MGKNYNYSNKPHQEKEEEKISYPSMKSQIILPLIFALTLTVGILFIAVDGFNKDLNEIIIWFYFGVVLLYTSLAVMDLFIRKEKEKKQKIFILAMSVATTIADALFIVFYLLSK